MVLLKVTKLAAQITGKSVAGLKNGMAGTFLEGYRPYF
jgi:hypothetical protein